VIPTEDEIKEMVDGQRTDFLTTYKKKKGSLFKNTLKKRVEANPDKYRTAQVVEERNIKNDPPVKQKTKKFSGSKKKPKKEVHSMVVDQEKSIGKLSNTKSRRSGEKPAVYKKKFIVGGKNRPSYKKLSPNAKFPSSKSKGEVQIIKRNSENSKESKNMKPSMIPRRPLSGNKSSSNYSKPLRRPQTAANGKGGKPQLSHREKEEKKVAKKTKDNTKFKPALKKQLTKDIEVKKDYSKLDMKYKNAKAPSGVISIELFDMDNSKEKDQHLDQDAKKKLRPYVKCNSQCTEVPKSMKDSKKKVNRMKKLHSHSGYDNNLKIPLNLLGDDFSPRDIKGEEIKKLEAPKPAQKVNKTSMLIAQAKERRSSKLGKSIDVD